MPNTVYMQKVFWTNFWKFLVLFCRWVWWPRKRSMVDGNGLEERWRRGKEYCDWLFNQIKLILGARVSVCAAVTVWDQQCYVIFFYIVLLLCNTQWFCTRAFSPWTIWREKIYINNGIIENTHEQYAHTSGWWTHSAWKRSIFRRDWLVTIGSTATQLDVQ